MTLRVLSGGTRLLILVGVIVALPITARGLIDATGGPIPANIASIFPVWNDWSTWDLAALSPITRFYRKSFAQSADIYDPVDTFVAWVQNDWAVTQRLTLNLGYATISPWGRSAIGTRLPYPNWGVVPMYFGDGWSSYHGLEMAIRKRFSNRWQASATYTPSGLWDAAGSPKVGFEVAPDLGGEYKLAATDLRHRADFSGGHLS